MVYPDVSGMDGKRGVRMDVIRMSGGIGNQMFQYALYLKLRSLGKEVKFDDVTEYALDNARPVMLWVFGIDYPKVTREELVEITDSSMDLGSRLRRKVFGRKSGEYHEKSPDYDEDVLKKENAYLCGCFQSERYFKDIEDTVREAFRFRAVAAPEGMGEMVKEYERQIMNSVAVSVHVRRGDYLDAAQVYGGICTEAYYDGAVAYMLERYPEARFFVFSNDGKWAEEWCGRKERELGREEKAQKRFVAVKGTTEENGYIDMMLMSKCRHHVIANSSFSWWGAWLNPAGDKCVVAPERWLNTCECRDVFTEGMVRVNAEGVLL